MENSHASLIASLGGVTAVAQKLGIKPPSVSGWIEDGRDGIPRGRLIELAAEIERVAGVPRWQLFPDDWHAIWPELVKAKGAPPVPAAEQEGA